MARTALVGVPKGKDGKLPGAIVLLSDGAQTRGVLTPMQGASRAHDAGIRVFTVALGTKNGTLGGLGGIYGGGLGPYGGQGRFPVRPDPKTLADIARATDGKSYQASSAAKVQDIYQQLGASIATRPTTREISSWFAGIAALLLFASLGAARITGERLP